MNVPQNLKYCDSDEWILIEGDTAKIGITDFAQSKLKDIVFVELPEEGRIVAKEEACVVIESVKTAVDVYSPLSGQVVAINTELEDAPEIMNEDPYGNGWIMELKLSNMSEADELMSAEDYTLAREGQ